MRNHVRALALVALVVLIAAACSKPKQEVSQTGGQHKGANALSPEELTKKGGGKTTVSNKGETVAEIGPGAKGYGALNPAADTTQAKKVGALIRLRSTSYSNPVTWAGVTKDTIKLAFNIDKTHCGTNLFQLLSQANANFSKGDRYTRPAPTNPDDDLADNSEAASATIRYWNDHVGDVANDIPQAVTVMKKYNTPGHNFYGRKLAFQFVDGGSFQCPSTTDSAAVNIATKIKPFSVVTYDVPGLNQSGYRMSQDLFVKAPASSRPMHFGLLDPNDKDLRRWAPYNWTEFQSITKESRLAASWICSRLNKHPAANSSDATLKTRPRKFGLLYPNNPTAKQAALDFKTFIKQGCGITFSLNSTEFQFADNPVNAPSDGNNIAVRLKLNNVTTAIYLIDFLGAFFHIEDFKGQNYKPEFLWIETAASTTAVQRLFASQDMVDKASMGYTPFGIQGFSYGPGDSFWLYHTYHKVAPDGKPCDPRSDYGMTRLQKTATGSTTNAAVAKYCRAPYNLGGWYYSWLPLIGGFIFAGPNLTPGNVSAGLQAYPQTRYGIDGPTTDPQAVLVGSGPGQYYFITDGSEYRWRADYVSPPPEQQFGWAEYPDCQRHYTLWPNGLAAGWEKSGPNYSAYCGNSKYAPTKPGPNEKTQTGAQATCADAPGKACDRDNYPRWNPIVYR
jgi:hypothetical protein